MKLNAALLRQQDVLKPYVSYFRVTEQEGWDISTDGSSFSGRHAVDKFSRIEKLVNQHAQPRVQLQSKYSNANKNGCSINNTASNEEGKRKWSIPQHVKKKQNRTLY